MRRVVSLFLPAWPTGRLRRHGHAGLPVAHPLVTRAHDRAPGLVVADADPEGDSLDPAAGGLGWLLHDFF